MFPAQHTQSLGRAAYERGVVECEKCHSPIYVDRPHAVSVEFCVPCSRCGHRGIYFKRMIRADDAAERRTQPHG